ncbi:uracil-DNA glycosylase [Aquirufa sp. ROCK-SH2]
MNVNLPDLLINDWKLKLKNQFEQSYFLKLQEELNKRNSEEVIYPPMELVFNALNLSSFDETKVIIIGQDPYHGAGQAHGLCFSVPDQVELPPSLKNIFKELEREYNPIFKKSSGNLSSWANQGVLLLNSVLTVQANQAASHSKLGWQHLTSYIIEVLNQEKSHLVFMLWGNYAQKIGVSINRSKHLVLECAHPSPLSANQGNWFGNGHFKLCNAYLIQHGIAPIEWI